MTKFKIGINGKEMIFSEQEMKEWFPGIFNRATRYFETFKNDECLTIYNSDKRKSIVVSRLSNSCGTSKTLREIAEDKVWDNEGELLDYYDIIFYDWADGDDHLKWVINASVDEIVNWASGAE